MTAGELRMSSSNANEELSTQCSATSYIGPVKVEFGFRGAETAEFHDMKNVLFADTNRLLALQFSCVIGS